MVLVHQTESFPKNGLTMILIVLLYTGIVDLTRGAFRFAWWLIGSLALSVPSYRLVDKGALLIVKLAKNTLLMTVFFDASRFAPPTSICDIVIRSVVFSGDDGSVKLIPHGRSLLGRAEVEVIARFAS